MHSLITMPQLPRNPSTRPCQKSWTLICLSTPFVRRHSFHSSSFLTSAAAFFTLNDSKSETRGCVEPLPGKHRASAAFGGKEDVWTLIFAGLLSDSSFFALEVVVEVSYVAISSSVLLEFFPDGAFAINSAATCLGVFMEDARFAISSGAVLSQVRWLVRPPSIGDQSSNSSATGSLRWQLAFRRLDRTLTPGNRCWLVSSRGDSYERHGSFRLRL